MFGGGGFGASQPTFGSGSFGTSANTGSVFGQPTQPVQQTASLFGGGSAFGAQSTISAFGSNAGTTTTSGFGAQTGSPSVFGQQARPAAGLFSSAGNTMSPFSNQQQAGTSISFNAITGTDTMMKNGAASQINTRHQCITCMKEYENKSLEELRLEDYQLNRKGPQNSMFGAQQPQAQQGGGLFSGIGATSTAGTSTFGQTSAFGQATNSGGLFGGLNQPKPGGFFGSGATPTSTAFGGGTGLGFSFSNPTSQPQTSIFGSNNNTVTSSAPGLGTTSAFPFSQPQQQQQGLGLFGQKSLATPTSNAPSFGGTNFGSPAQNTTLPKPILFGSATGTGFGTTAAPTFGSGTGSLFSNNQQQQQNKPFSFTMPFSQGQATSQPAFGATTGTSTFSFSNPVSTPALNFSSNTGTAPTFGATPGTTTGSAFGAPIPFSLGAGTQQAQAGTSGGFGTGFFSSGSNTATGNTGLSLFNTSGTGTNFATGGLQQQQQFQMQQQQQQQVGTISFATTPYKDNQLFYNLISNRKLEDLSKPTNPLAQRQFREASRRKTSTGPGSTVTICTSPAVKTLTFPTTRKSSSISKFQIFDGFEDDYRAVGVDILSPKSNVKKLIFKSIDSITTTVSTGVYRSVEFEGLGSPLNKSITMSSVQSPIVVHNNRARIAFNSTLNNGELGGLIDGEANRTIDFGDSILDTSRNDASYLNTSLNGSVNHDISLNNSGTGDIFGGVNNGHGVYSTPSSSKRDSEGEIVPSVGESFVNETGFPNDIIPGSICGLICTRPGYYLRPPVEELDKKMDANGNCFIRGFEIGRINFGRIRFVETVNLANINIDETVLFRHKEVVVYPDDTTKPPLGQGLNVPAEIELERVWPIDKQSNDPIRSSAKIKALNYEQKLRRANSRLDSDFVSYNEELGIWKFKVRHFSKYSCEIEENEEEETNAPIASTSKGLGGIPMVQQQKQITRYSAPGPAGDSLPISLPISRLPIPSHFTATVPQSLTPPSGLSTHDHLQIMDGATSDVELNPLTPCDSDDEDDDDEDDDDDEEDHLVVRRRGMFNSSRQTLPKYKPVLKDSGTEKSRLMKSVLSMDDFCEEESPVPLFDNQPPAKKPRKPARVSFMAAPYSSTSSEWIKNVNTFDRLKERLSAGADAFTPIPAGPVRTIVPKQPIMFNSAAQPDQIKDNFRLLRTRVSTASRTRGGPKVCFLPSGHFITVNQTISQKGFNAELKLNQFYSYADKQVVAPVSRSIRNVLERQMQTRLKKPHVLFRDHIRILGEEISSCVVPQVKTLLEEELVIWQLCDILWPELDNNELPGPRDDGAQLTQRQRLGEWLFNHGPTLFGSLYKKNDTSVLGWMKKGNLEEACATAMEEDNFSLSVVLTTSPYMLLGYLEDPELLKQMPQDHSDIFNLVAGNMTKLESLTPSKIERMTTNEWFQYFALYLWYDGPLESTLTVPVEQAVRNYEAMMRMMTDEDECPFPEVENSSVANLCMHLLKMYSCTGYPIQVVLTPRTWTKDCLEYKLGWLLMQDLEYIGITCENSTFTDICLGYTGQLEAIGMWKWTQFVMDHLPGPRTHSELMDKTTNAKNAFCMRILERNVDGSNEESLELERFLAFELSVDDKQIYSIKSWKTDRADQKMWYLGKMGSWQHAFNIFKTYLHEGKGLDLIGDRVPSFAGAMLLHLEEMSSHEHKIMEWEIHGKMLLNFLRMCNRVGKPQDPSLTDVVINYLEAVIQYTPTNTSQCAFMLDMSLNGQKIIQLLLTEPNMRDEVRELIHKYLVPFLDLPVPKEYFEGLRSFVNIGLTSQRSETCPVPHTPLSQLEYEEMEYIVESC